MDPCEQDCHGNNVVHNMIMQIFYNPELEDTILESFAYLVTLLSEDQIRRILMAENTFSLRPVQFAAQHGSCRMVIAIMDIPGVYFYREERHGLTTYQWYDVTDYEASAERFAKSPLLLLTFIDMKTISHNIETNGFNELYTKSLMAKWLDAKFKTNIPFILMLLVFRVMYIACYIALDMDTSFYDKEDDFVPDNSTNHCRPSFAPVMSFSTKTALRSILFICPVCVIVIDIIEISVNKFKGYWHLNNAVEGKKHWVVQAIFYKYANLIFSIFVLIYVCLGVSHVTVSPTFTTYFVSSAPFWLCGIYCISFSFFLQLEAL